MYKKISPYSLIGLSFLILMIGSAILLSMPFMLKDGVEVPFLDNLFTTTSALCVTGLSTFDLSTTYTVYGQVLVLILIQLGGLGILTFSSMIVLLVSKKINYYTKKVIQEDINYDILSNIPSYLKQVAFIVFSIEFIGAVLLFQTFIKKYTIGKAIYYSIFHSISAFCNAGFALYSDSLISYQSDIFVNIIISFLIILGGLGFAAILDFYYRIKGIKKYFTITTKFTIYVTSSLLIVGMMVIFLLEYTNVETIGNLTLKDKILVSWFESVTLRTAGFSTINQTSLRPITKVFSMLWMFIGAGPGSTGGGIKTTTLGVILLGVYFSIKNKEKITVFKRTISWDTYKKATSIFLIASLYIFISYMILLILEDRHMLETLYELISAFGTVGLSLDFTSNLHSISKCIIIFTMFIGRIGPLTLVLALSRKTDSKEKYKYPTENILIG